MTFGAPPPTSLVYYLNHEGPGDEATQSLSGAVNVTLGTYCNRSTVEPPIVDPPRKGQCMLTLSIKDIVEGPKKLLSL